MSWPKLPKFGIIDNPILETPFASNNDEDSSFSNQAFLLMDTTHFLLMDGTDLLLMGS